MRQTAAEHVQLSLRSQIEIVRLEAQEYILCDLKTGERYEFGAPERFLLHLLDGRRTQRAICHAYREHFGRDLPLRTLREFLEQLRQLDLLESASSASTRGGVGSGEPTLSLAADLDSRATLNRRFDWLVLLFGWAVHWLCLVPILLLAMIGFSGLIQRADLYLADLSRVSHNSPLLPLAMGLLQRFFVVTLLRELLVGVCCRRHGGWVRAFRIHYFARLLPGWRCDVGDSAALMTTTGRWKMMTLRSWCHLGLGSLALIGWLMAPRGTVLSTFCVVLTFPTLIGMFLMLNPLVPGDSYSVLTELLRVPALRQRALTQTRAFLTANVAPEACTARERFWLRLYGLGVYAWQAVVAVMVFGFGGWWLSQRYDGIGALATCGVAVWCYQDTIKKLIRRPKRPDPLT